MKKAYLLDTNVILRLILKDNLDQYKIVTDLLEQSELGKISLYCPTISIFETAFVLLGSVYKTDKFDVAKILTTILNIKLINFENEAKLLKALDIFTQNSISIVDSYLIAESILDGKVFFSFDTKANKSFKKSN